jgi:hypothetical protein
MPVKIEYLDEKKFKIKFAGTKATLKKAVTQWGFRAFMRMT